jgi:putative acetyltransferase
MTQAAEAAGLTIRNVTPDDEAAVRELVMSAFPSDMEARLVHTLRHCGALVLEQVAVDADGRIVGHIAYSRVTWLRYPSGRTARRRASARP